MDRCALFVDASYVLADGAMAVHGTRRGESVSWDYEGLLQLLGGMARERTGLPLLRCYWYEATVDGRRTAEQGYELAADHSITSSARASSIGGTSSPSILAVWALITNSNLDACTTGKSAGLAPLRTRPV